MYILQVADVEGKKIIFQHPQPNSEFTPPVCSLIADENDSFSVAFYCDILKTDLELLQKHTMMIGTPTFDQAIKPISLKNSSRR